MRKQLETVYLCDALKGRVTYFATRYRLSHDSMGRVSILVDKKEVYKSCFYDWQLKRQAVLQEINETQKRNTSYKEIGAELKLRTLNKGGFDQFSFYNAFYAYQNQPIKTSLDSEDPIVRLFAILDKRTGKRMLKKWYPL